MADSMMEWSIRDYKEPVVPGSVMMDGWELKRLLGRGGFGDVWLADKKLLGIQDQSAIKIIRIPRDPDEINAMRAEGFSGSHIQAELRRNVENAVREIRTMIDLRNHPAIVPCESFDVIQYEEDESWEIDIRMQLLTPLADWVNSREVKPDDVLRMGVSLSDLLSVCEKKNILHRDIKPANIFVDQLNNFKLGDFGLARIISETGSAHSKGVGTEAFMAPEVFRSGQYDHRADLYSLGLVMYWLLNGQSLPFTGESGSRSQAISRRLSGEALPGLPGVDPELDRIIRKACEADPEKRWKTAKEFHDALVRFQYKKDAQVSQPEVKEPETKGNKSEPEPAAKKEPVAKKEPQPATKKEPEQPAGQGVQQPKPKDPPSSPGRPDTDSDHSVSGEKTVQEKEQIRQPEQPKPKGPETKKKKSPGIKIAVIALLLVLIAVAVWYFMGNNSSIKGAGQTAETADGNIVPDNDDIPSNTEEGTETYTVSKENTFSVITVSAVVKGNDILQCEINSASENGTDLLTDEIKQEWAEAIVKTDTAETDAITGATLKFSAQSVRDAVAEILESNTAKLNSNTAASAAASLRQSGVSALPDSLDETRTIAITFWAKNDTNKDQTAVYQQAVDGFQALYPNVKVSMRLYTDYSRICNDVITNISTNTTPNVCITYPDHIATYITGANTVTPLDDLMADSRFGLGGSEVRFDAPKQEELVPEFLKECVIGGQTYALPYMRSTEVLYVNEDLVKQLGYELPDTVTWDFVWEVSEKALEKNEDGTFRVNGQKTMIPFICKSTDNMMITMLKQLDAPYVSENGEVLMFSDTTKSLLEEIYNHGKSRAFSTFAISSYPSSFLNAGQCIFAIDSTAGATWMGSSAPMQNIASDQVKSFSIRVMPVPQFDPDHPKMISQGPSLCLFKSEDPQELLASWLFTQYLLTDEIQTAYARTEGYLPVTLKALQSREYREYLSRKGEDNQEYYSVKIEASELLYNNLANTFTAPAFNGSASVHAAAGQLVENACKAARRNQPFSAEDLFNEVIALYRLDSLPAAK